MPTDWNRIKAIQKLNEQELQLNMTGSQSWHDKFRHSAYIYVANLPFSLNEGDIIVAFSQFGEIVDCNLIRDHESGESKGYCFIAFEDQRSTVLAVDNMNGCQILSRSINVDHVLQYRKPRLKGERKKDKYKKTNNETINGAISEDDETYDNRRKKIWDYEKYLNKSVDSYQNENKNDNCNDNCNENGNDNGNESNNKDVKVKQDFSQRKEKIRQKLLKKTNESDAKRLRLEMRIAKRKLKRQLTRKNDRNNDRKNGSNQEMKDENDGVNSDKNENDNDDSNEDNLAKLQSQLNQLKQLNQIESNRVSKEENKKHKDIARDSHRNVSHSKSLLFDNEIKSIARNQKNKKKSKTSSTFDDSDMPPKKRLKRASP